MKIAVSGSLRRLSAMSAALAWLCVLAGAWLCVPVVAGPASAPQIRAAPEVKDGLRVSANRRYFVDARTGRPVFLLADTAWNLGALTLAETDRYLQSRADHGFNAVLFALSFAPQADARNAYGQPAYIGPDRTTLNPAYFATCDTVVRHAAARGLFVVLVTMWAGEKAGTMNGYDAAGLAAIGRALGRRYAGVPNVIFCAGGEASPPHYIDAARVNALGRALKDGCAGRNLVTVHPQSPHSGSEFYADSSWLDFYLCQAKSGTAPANAAFDAAALVLGDWRVANARPTLMGEHRYESGTAEDPLIQRRTLYQCVFAGAAGHVYGHNALWQMTPHTGLPWMLHGWSPGVADWTQALDTPAVRQLAFIKALLFAHPYLTRIPDQALILAGQGADVAGRAQATRDGTPGGRDATYLMAYLSAPAAVTLDTGVLPARTLTAYWFRPATGRTQDLRARFPNPGRLTLPLPPSDGDWVVVVEDASRHYPRP